MLYHTHHKRSSPKLVLILVVGITGLDIMLLKLVTKTDNQLMVSEVRN